MNYVDNIDLEFDHEKIAEDPQVQEKLADFNSLIRWLNSFFKPQKHAVAIEQISDVILYNEAYYGSVRDEIFPLFEDTTFKYTNNKIERYYYVLRNLWNEPVPNLTINALKDMHAYINNEGEFDRQRRKIDTRHRTNLVKRVEIDDYLQKVCDIYNDRSGTIHPLIRQAHIHTIFEVVQPFYGDLGRTKNVINLMMLKRDYNLQFPIDTSTHLDSLKNLFYAKFILNIKTNLKEMTLEREIDITKEWASISIQTIMKVIRLIKGLVPINEEIKDHIFNTPLSKKNKLILAKFLSSRPKFRAIDYMDYSGIKSYITTKSHLKIADQLKLTRETKASRRFNNEIIYENALLRDVTFQCYQCHNHENNTPKETLEKIKREHLRHQATIIKRKQRARHQAEDVNVD